MSSPELAVRCKDLVKRYADVVAVDGLDLEVHRGECFGLLGPNGAGKTTTVEILEGLLEPTSGEVEILGKRWSTDEAWLRERLGVSLQLTFLPELLTVREILTLFRSLYQRGRSIDETIDLVLLREKEHARYATLSGGQRQRLAVACALVSQPSLLFLDEPTTGLDPQSRRMLWDVIVAFKKSGGTVVLTTHYMDEADKLCDRVGVVDRGKSIALGTPKELIGSLGGDRIVELSIADVTDGLVDALRAAPGVQAARAHALGVSLAASEIHVALPAVLEVLRQSGVDLTDLSTHEATLEDVFVTLTGRALRE
ncbi:MAG: ABC transporter ATP-binding protein [Labilithrix sp.]|nr:ABC transporter ATP-binding protein [Labilithrix sp.]